MRQISVVVVLLLLAGCETNTGGGYSPQPYRTAQPFQFQPVYLQPTPQRPRPVTTNCQPSYNGSVVCRSY